MQVCSYAGAKGYQSMYNSLAIKLFCVGAVCSCRCQGLFAHAGPKGCMLMQVPRAVCSCRAQGLCAHAGPKGSLLMQVPRAVCSCRSQGLFAHAGPKGCLLMQVLRAVPKGARLLLECAGAVVAAAPSKFKVRLHSLLTGLLQLSAALYAWLVLKTTESLDLCDWIVDHICLS